MASFSEGDSPSAPHKLFQLGNPGSGKTGSLLSLAAAGYNLRILDFDNGCQLLKDFVLNPASPYRKANPGLWTAAQAASLPQRVHFETLTDAWRKDPASGVMVPKAATAWPRALNLLNKWDPFGPVSKWTSSDVLVVDSLTFLAKAIMRYVLTLNGRIGKKPADTDYGQAQDQLLSFIETLYAEEIQCHVIYNCHIKQFKLGNVKRDDGRDSREEVLSKGFPETIGRAISPSISRYVNSVLLADTSGFGRATKRQILTQSTELIDLKTIAPLRVKPHYPLETGLLQYFLDTGTTLPETDPILSTSKELPQ